MNDNKEPFMLIPLILPRGEHSERSCCYCVPLLLAAAIIGCGLSSWLRQSQNHYAIESIATLAFLWNQLVALVPALPDQEPVHSSA